MEDFSDYPEDDYPEDDYPEDDYITDQIITQVVPVENYIVLSQVYDPVQYYVPTYEDILSYSDIIVSTVKDIESKDRGKIRYFRFIYPGDPYRLSDVIFSAKTELGAYVAFLEKMSSDGLSQLPSASYGESYYGSLDVDGFRNKVDSLMGGSVEPTMIQQNIVELTFETKVKANVSDTSNIKRR